MAARADLHAAYQCPPAHDDDAGRVRGRSGRSSPNSTRNSAGIGVARPARPARPRPTPGAAAVDPASAGRTEPAPPPGRAPHGRAAPTRAATGPPPSSRSPATPTGGWTPTAPRWTRTATTTAAPPATRSTSRSWWTGSARTLRRCVGWEVQYFGTIEPQRRGAPHFHAAAARHHPPRRAAGDRRRDLPPGVVAQPRRHQVHRGSACRAGTDDAQGFVDPDDREPLPTCDEATDPRLDRAGARRHGSGPQVHVKGILGGTEEAGRHIGYLTKYLTKDVAKAAGLDDGAYRPAARASPPAGRRAGTSPRARRSARCGCSTACSPKGARHAMEPGVCKGKAHRPQHLGIAGRRVLVSRKWSNKTLDDHARERTAFVRQLLDQAPASGPATRSTTAPIEWEKTSPGDPDVPSRPALLLPAIAERQRWKADYMAAQVAGWRPARCVRQLGRRRDKQGRSGRAADGPPGARTAGRRLPGHVLRVA